MRGGSVETVGVLVVLLWSLRDSNISSLNMVDGCENVEKPAEVAGLRGGCVGCVKCCGAMVCLAFLLNR